MRFSCWKCGEVIELQSAQRVASRDACQRCDADLHCCRNCRFYDPSKNNQCAEPQAEWVREKEAANYCDYFQPIPILLAKDKRPSSPAENAMKKFNALFKI